MIRPTPEEEKVIKKFLENGCISDGGVMMEFFLPKVRAKYEQKAHDWKQRQEAAKIILAHLLRPPEKPFK